MGVDWKCVRVCLVLSAFSVTALIAEASGEQRKACAFPGTSWHGVVLSPHAQEFPHNTTVRYGCDADYTLVGLDTRVCHDGQWNSPPPECLREMALRKPALLTADTAEHAALAVDGQTSTCVSSKLDDDKPFWAVDIIEPSKVKYIHIVFGEHATNITIEVRVGNHYPTTGAAFNTVCKRMTVDIVPGAHFYFKCPDTIFGRHVSVGVMSSGHRMSLCDVHVFTGSSLTEHDVCPDLIGHPDVVTGSFNTHCVEVLRYPVRDIDTARQTCRDLGGHLLDRVDRNLQEYVNWYTETYVKENKQMSLWLAAERTRNRSGQWRWFSGGQVTDVEISGDDAGTGKDCLVIEGAAWWARSCAEQHYVVCIHNASTCGTLPTPEKAANWHNLDKVPVNETSKVYCEENLYIDGDEIRCFANGSISQRSPVCLPFTCDLSLENGTVTRVGATNRANFSCHEGYILETSGGSELRCIDGRWSSMTPVCLADSNTSRFLKGALDEFHEMKENLKEVSILSKIPAHLMDWVIVAAVIIACILLLVGFGLCGLFVYRRRKATTAKVTISSPPDTTGV